MAQIPLLPAILAEIKNVGKKLWQGILILFALIIGIFCFIFPEYCNIFLLLSISLFANAFFLLETYANEILPTKIRDFGAAFFRGIAKFGAISSQFIFLSLAKTGKEITIIFYLICLSIAILNIYFLPKTEIEDLDSYLDLTVDTDENEMRNNQK